MQYNYPCDMPGLIAWYYFYSYQNSKREKSMCKCKNEWGEFACIDIFIGVVKLHDMPSVQIFSCNTQTIRVLTKYLILFLWSLWIINQCYFRCKRNIDNFTVSFSPKGIYLPGGDIMYSKYFHNRVVLLLLAKFAKPVQLRGHKLVNLSSSLFNVI